MNKDQIFEFFSRLAEDNPEPETELEYGNAYQLWFGRPEIESLGNRRYEVKVQGGGARLNLEPELQRLLSHLQKTGQLAAQADQAARDALIEAYLEGYRAEVRRKVQRYKRRLQRAGNGQE